MKILNKVSVETNVDQVSVEALLEVVVDGIVGDARQHHHVVHAMLAGIRLFVRGGDEQKDKTHEEELRRPRVFD